MEGKSNEVQAASKTAAAEAIALRPIPQEAVRSGAADAAAAIAIRRDQKHRAALERDRASPVQFSLRRLLAGQGNQRS